MAHVLMQNSLLPEPGALRLAPRKTRVLATVHAPGNGAIITCRDQRQLAEDVR